MIDRVFVTNLKRRSDKWFYMLGYLEARDFPFWGSDSPWGDTIVRFICEDGGDYPGLDAVKTAAVKDGFPSLAERDWHGPRHLAWTWSWGRALRTIVEMRDKIVMMLIDDCVPIYDLRQYEGFVRACYKEDSYFRGLFLHEMWNESDTRPEKKPIPYESMLQIGIYGKSNFGFILSAAGAEYLLNILHKHPNHPCDVVHHAAKAGIESEADRRGFYTTLQDVVVHSPFSHNVLESDLMLDFS